MHNIALSSLTVEFHRRECHDWRKCVDASCAFPSLKSKASLPARYQNRTLLGSEGEEACLKIEKERKIDKIFAELDVEKK